MTILNVAYPFAPVSPDTVGGAEQVLAMIDRGLVTSGMGSVILAAKGSRTRSALVELPTSVHIDDHVRNRTYRDYARLILETIAEQQIDLVHMHGVDFAQYIPISEVPVLVTLHLPLDYYPSFPSHRRYTTVFNAVSEWQRRQCPTDLRPELIGNGVDIDALSPSGGKADFVLMLGRICPEKGFHLGLEAALSARVTCLLAGQVYGYTDHQRYFSREILPRLDARRRFLGPVGGSLKRYLLSAARCVLIPSLVAETSSLVAMEALACGTPIVAFRSGALVDIVIHRKTGFLVESVEEMAEAISVINYIDPAECREDACRRFSAAEMVGKYLRLYEHMIGSSL
jgi:glycosyltransferase involved in cell wall biosynthesis